MNSTVPRLRPMNLGDLLDSTFALYRENFALFAGIVAVITIPETLINLGLSMTTGGVLLGIVTAILSLVFGILSEGALALAVSRRYLGQTISIEQAYVAIGSATFMSLIVASIAYGLTIGVGFVLFIIPGIYLAVRYLFVSQVIVIERRGIGDAFRRSSELVRGMWWRVFGIGIVLFVLVLILEGLGAGVASTLVKIGGTGNRVLGTVISALVSILVTPIQLIALTLLYYDLRIRKEGFDIELLASQLNRDINA